MNKPDASPKPAILVVPLDWGLGHGTRCIPVIRSLLNNNCNVFLAGEGQVKALLQAEFPSLPFLELRGYRVHYAKKGWKLPISIMLQFPSIISTIYYENRWIRKQIRDLDINGIIADNRYGLYNRAVPSVFITHQLYISSGLGNAIDKIIQLLNYRFINRFSECWVPDCSVDNNLAGKLSHPLLKPKIKLKYSGILSRFHPRTSEGKHILILISGPEPQRTLFEQFLMNEVKLCKERIVIIRGQPGGSESIIKEKNIEIINHLPAAALEEKIARATFVIARTGYSTIMDLVRMKKKSILIPTPGQPEQEYLAQHLMQHNIALCIGQSEFKLAKAISLAKEFNYKFPEMRPEENIEVIVSDFIGRICNIPVSITK